MKTKLVPFDIEKAKQGAKIVTDDGKSVTILTYNKRLKNGDTIIVALVDMGSYDDTLHFNHDGIGFPYTLFIEEEVKTRRMTNKELAHWLSPIHGHFRERLTGCGNIASTLLYSMDEENDEVEKFDLIREDFGEWKEPLIEI